jgi:uncharacterized YigZ family protein
MFLYNSILDYGEAEYIVEKSRFIAHAMPVTSLDEAKEYAASVKEEYRDATHNVPAIIVGAKQEVQWASDDGEPSGTSGLPMLKLIAGEGLTNLAVVVTRYFGGIKLGTGGLARAYTAAAKLGLDAAGRCEVMESALIRYEFDYSYLSKLQNLAEIIMERNEALKEELQEKRLVNRGSDAADYDDSGRVGSVSSALEESNLGLISDIVKQSQGDKASSSDQRIETIE